MKFRSNLEHGANDEERGRVYSKAPKSSAIDGLLLMAHRQRSVYEWRH
jgi:hypothetical protein